ncbi:MAG: lamin tail domain-containing protein [Bacteroidota bacterium]
MKKCLLFLLAMVPAMFAIAQTDCSDIIISEYVEGWNNNKAIELYNPTNVAITLDNVYRLIRYSNGATDSEKDPLYNLPLPGTIGAFQSWVIIQDTTKPGQDTMVWPPLRKKADWCAPYDYGGTTQGGNCVFWNGDDAISLQKKQNNGTWKDIDIFGEIGVRPKNWQGTYNPSGAWTDTKPYILGTGKYLTKSKTLVRKHTVKHGIDRIAMSHYGDSLTGGVPNSFYALKEYDSLSANFFDSLGTHWCDCKTSWGVNELQHGNRVTIQPNPVTDNQFRVISAAVINSVEILSVVGQSVFFRNCTSHLRDLTVHFNDLPAGVYLVKIISVDNQAVIKKIIIQ